MGAKQAPSLAAAGPEPKARARVRPPGDCPSVGLRASGKRGRSRCCWRRSSPAPRARPPAARSAPPLAPPARRASPPPAAPPAARPQLRPPAAPPARSSARRPGLGEARALPGGRGTTSPE
ncbi:unnamed protein product [Nyctereutes procyonoides]|uniref:(raccoon dog) hypothetical protein n=1 Tax=Nyctereutes procyonoides TaxID=34880 RepID=A0A811ZWD2_NYCPR|nr:unnamed protein product [Nyctereutes procyonoides]